MTTYLTRKNIMKHAHIMAKTLICMKYRHALAFALKTLYKRIKDQSVFVVVTKTNNQTTADNFQAAKNETIDRAESFKGFKTLCNTIKMIADDITENCCIWYTVVQNGYETKKKIYLK